MTLTDIWSFQESLGDKIAYRDKAHSRNVFSCSMVDRVLSHQTTQTALLVASYCFSSDIWQVPQLEAVLFFLSKMC
jgi:hypothetical protein